MQLTRLLPQQDGVLMPLLSTEAAKIDKKIKFLLTDLNTAHHHCLIRNNSLYVPTVETS